MFLLLCFTFVYATLYADRYGNREIILNNASASLTLPNSTVIAEVNVLNTLQQLQQAIFQLQLDLNIQRAQFQQELSQIRGCAWEGIACHCYYRDATNDIAAMVGSNCTNGTLHWVKVIDIFTATAFLGCSYLNYSICNIVL